VLLLSVDGLSDSIVRLHDEVKTSCLTFSRLAVFEC
jgi:hypothetical protein